MLSLCFRDPSIERWTLHKISAFFHHLSNQAEADAEADADEVEGVESMVVQTGELHHHIDEKIGHYRCDVEKREIQFSISPVAEFKDLIKQTDGDGKKQVEPGRPCW